MTHVTQTIQGHTVTVTGPDAERTARLLVACWGWFKGVSTEHHEFAQKISDLREQRDELLKSLKFVMSAHGEQLEWAFQQAHDVIAKAEKRND